MEQKLKLLLLKYEKKELAEKLGISRPTLNKRLEKNNWKKLEIEKLLKL
jgi:DNA-binding Xre family transcriptional regulator